MIDWFFSVRPMTWFLLGAVCSFVATAVDGQSGTITRTLCIGASLICTFALGMIAKAAADAGN